MGVNMKNNIVFCTIFLLLFNACAKPTGYVMRDVYGGSKYGCNDKKISDDEFAVIAEGNEYSTAEHVAKLALYHAAHVTIKNEKQFFQILQKTEKTLPNHQVITIPLILYGGVVFIPVAGKPTSEITSILIIRLVAPADSLTSNCINAKQVITELKPILEKK